MPNLHLDPGISKLMEHLNISLGRKDRGGHSHIRALAGLSSADIHMIDAVMALREAIGVLDALNDDK